jgi:hypothetical protein
MTASVFCFGADVEDDGVRILFHTRFGFLRGDAFRSARIGHARRTEKGNERA